MTNEKRLQANCLQCGWYGWSDQTHICEFGEVMPAMQDIMRIAPESDVGGTLTKILAKQQQEDKRLQALAELQEDGERMEREASDWLKEEEKRVASILDGSSFACCCVPAKPAYKAGFNKGAELERERVLDLVMDEVEKNKAWVSSCNVYAVGAMELQAIISKLRGEKPATDKLSPEYKAAFKQAQADNPNLHLYFGGEEDED